METNEILNGAITEIERTLAVLNEFKSILVRKQDYEIASRFKYITDGLEINIKDFKKLKSIES